MLLLAMIDCFIKSFKQLIYRLLISLWFLVRIVLRYILYLYHGTNKQYNEPGNIFSLPHIGNPQTV